MKRKNTVTIRTRWEHMEDGTTLVMSRADGGPKDEPMYHKMHLPGHLSQAQIASVIREFDGIYKTGMESLRPDIRVIRIWEMGK